MRRKLRDGTIWVYTPLLAMAADVFDARIRPLEAWVWPEHTRYLDLWASQLDKARRALEGPPPSYRPLDPDDAAVTAAVKETYAGAITLFGSPQLAGDADGRDTRAPAVPAGLVAHDPRHGRRPAVAEDLRGRAQSGRWPLAIDRDNLLYAADRRPGPGLPRGPDPRQARQAGQPDGQRARPGQEQGIRLHGRRRAAASSGEIQLRPDLTSRADWDPDNGGRRDGGQ